MACTRPIARIETNDGTISFESPQLKDAESLKAWHQKLENSRYVKSLKLMPCGRCTACRLDYAKEWANRITLECEEYESNFFITLTYNDENLHKKILKDENGKILGLSNTLDKKDLQDFLKRLRTYYKRKYNHENIRYYACGEYVDISERAHYHAIIFNLPIWDLEYHGKSNSGEAMYISKEIQEIWGKGYVTIQEVTWNSASYVARYVMKKRYGKEAQDYYESRGKIPEFCTMSLKPGIGQNYYEKHKHEIYKTDSIYIPCKDNIIKTKPFKYYDEMYEKEFPEEFKKIKVKREANMNSNNIIMAKRLKTTNNIQRQREIKERNLNAKAVMLKREL